MKTKILLAAGVLAAFIFGTMAGGIYTATTRAFTPTEEKALAAEENPQPSTGTSRTHLVQPASRGGFTQPGTVVKYTPPTIRSAETAPVAVSRTQKKRSLGKEVLIVGGSAGAGAGVGAIAGGKKGAAIGAVSGGVAGLIYDLATRNK